MIGSSVLERREEEAIRVEQQRFMTKVYGWMSSALLITATVAMYVASKPAVLQTVVGTPLFWVLIIGQLGMVMGLVGFVQKMRASTATAVFIVYSALNGITLSSIFLIYTAASVANTFFITAGMFGVMSAYGLMTKKDLTGWGSLLRMALLGLIIASVVNLFMRSETIYWLLSYAGVLIFVGLTAYDTQKIKKMSGIGEEGSEEQRKGAIIGALTLYLDFINLFLHLLRVMGKRQ